MTAFYAFEVTRGWWVSPLSPGHNHPITSIDPGCNTPQGGSARKSRLVFILDPKHHIDATHKTPNGVRLIVISVAKITTTKK
jgi:hypothetical protein